MQLFKYFLGLMDPDVSLLRSHNPHAGAYSEPVESSQQTYILLLLCTELDYFILIAFV